MKRQKSFESQGPALYLVPTPIGNLQEMTPRALEVLSKVDAVAAEDTRNTGLLLQKFELKKPLISHHEHNQKESIPRILDRLKNGESIAVVSDAGYPLISDPGAALVNAVIDGGWPVVPLSGCNAALDALAASGLPADHFVFYGFLSAKSAQRKKELESLKQIPFTLLFYEAPHRIEKMLADMKDVFGNREICLARELTKLHEEFLRGSLDEVIEALPGLKGEMVVVVAGYEPEAISVSSLTDEVWALEEQGLSRMAAVKQVAKSNGISKNQLYKQMLSEESEEVLDGEADEEISSEAEAEEESAETLEE